MRAHKIIRKNQDLITVLSIEQFKLEFQCQVNNVLFVKPVKNTKLPSYTLTFKNNIKRDVFALTFNRLSERIELKTKEEEQKQKE